MKNKIARFWPLTRNRLLLFIALSIPVLAFFYQYISSGSKILTGDFDYYSQMYEAFRISVLHYHQFPLWNPWMSGGLPLFANPQFGLVSIQSLLVLPLGAVYGLKLAYVIYALSGFWGMYLLCRQVLIASRTRSLLIAYIWIFCGFFAGHNISHFTFALFFLLPWQFYFLAKWRSKRSWLYFGLLESLLVLSSVHYAFLMTSFAVGLFILCTLLGTLLPKQARLMVIRNQRGEFLLFLAKALSVIFVLTIYRLATTFYFIHSNPKIPALLIDRPYPPLLLVKALFLPIGTHLNVPTGLQWGWAEYSMYAGLGFTISLIVTIFSLLHSLFRKRTLNIHNPVFIIVVLCIGLCAACIALGDFATYAPYHILRTLPGYSQTRVAIRWLIFTIFALLLLVAAWPKQRKIIDILLLLAIVELFVSYGPRTSTGKNEVKLPPTTYSNTFTEYDNGKMHTVNIADKNQFYTYTTAENMGQIYSDDSIINTLNGVYNTRLCGKNVNPKCDLVLSHNAVINQWTPNKIVLSRTSSGVIDLNMNAEKGWKVNGVYIFGARHNIDPATSFSIPSDRQTRYVIEYVPKGSLQWLSSKLK